LKLIDVPLRCAAVDTAVAEGSVLGSTGPTGQSETELVMVTVALASRIGVGAGLATEQQEVVAVRQCSGAVKSIAKDDGRLMETAEVWSCVEIPCRPPLCISKSCKPAEVDAVKQCSIGSTALKCKRCGDCGHAHESCTSSKPIWGRDWRKYRERRRHRRSMRRPEKSGIGGDAGVKTKTSVDGRLKELEDSEEHESAPRKLRQVEQLREVAPEGCTSDLGQKSSGTESDTWSDVRPKEVDAFEEKQPGARLMRQAERIKEVAYKNAERVEVAQAAAGSLLQIRELKEVATESGISGDKHIAGPVGGS
jgi:hypothetical protein